MTEVRWFLSIQFSKSLSRGGLFNLGHSGLGVKHFLLLDPAFRALPDVTGSATIRKVDPAVNPQIRCFRKNLGKPRKTGENTKKQSAARQPGGVGYGRKKKKGEEFQGKEGMSWMELPTGRRAPR